MLLDEMKLVLRVSSPAYDAEVQMLIDAAIADMLRCGVREEVVFREGPLVKNAVACFCKSRFGFDNDDSASFDGFYRQAVIDLLNSSANVASEWACE